MNAAAGSLLAGEKPQFLPAWHCCAHISFPNVSALAVVWVALQAFACYFLPDIWERVGGGGDGECLPKTLVPSSG